MEPDKWDRAYIQRQLCGFAQLLNEQKAVICQQHEQQRNELLSWHERIAQMETLLAERDALVGELRARLELLEQRHEKMRTYLRERFKGNGQPDHLVVPVVQQPVGSAGTE